MYMDVLGISKINVTVKLLGTRFINAISCFKSDSRSLTGKFFKHPVEQFLTS
jgi:hypothetical protein